MQCKMAQLLTLFNCLHLHFLVKYHSRPLNNGKSIPMNTNSTPSVQKSSKAIILSLLVHHNSRNFQFSWSYLLIFSPTAGAALVLEFKKSPNYLQIHVGRDGAPHWSKVSYLIQCSRGHCTNPQELTGFLRNHIVTHSYSPQAPLTTVPCHLGHS